MRTDLIHKIFNSSITSNNLANKDLDDLCELSAKHRIKQIFIDAICLTQDKRVNFEEHAKQYTKYSCTRDMKILSEANQISNILDDLDITFVFLKGTAFKMSIYKNSFWRDCRDIDILVNPSDVKKTLLALFEKGYRYIVAEDSQNTDIDYINTHQAPVLRSPNGQYLEVHFRITMENDECLLAQDMLKNQKNHIAAHHLNLIHVSYHALVLNRLNNGLMSLVDINYLLKKVSKREAINASKKYKLKETTKHMIELYEINIAEDKAHLKKTDMLYISNELIHAGEALVGFRTNLINIKKSLNNFQKKYLGNSESKINLFKLNISFIKYISMKLFFHISSVLKNPNLWIKRNKLKKYIKRTF
jgi:hypothetical protein